MAKPESKLRKKVLELLSPLHAVAIESHIEAGVPDVNCTVGWIELKHLDEWPARSETVVQVHRYTEHQRNWLRRRCAHGGSAWLLLRVEHEWCLVWGPAAADSLGVVWRRSDLVMLGQQPSGPVCYWQRQPESRELIYQLLHRNWLRS